MGAQNVNIKPRQKAPKAQTPAEREALQMQQELKAKQLAAQAEQQAAHPNVPEYFEDNFADPSAALAGADPKQVQSLLAAANPIAEQLAPNDSEPAPKKELPQEAQIKNVDVAAGLEPNVPKATGPVTPPTPKPPATRQEYERQQRGVTTSFPDVADVFMGKIPSEKPINDIAALQPIVVPPPIEHHVTITHEPPPKEMAYQLTRDFAGYLGRDGGWVEFKKGVVIYETYVVEQLLNSGFDGLQPLEVASAYLTCPVCKHQFPPEAGK